MFKNYFKTAIRNLWKNKGYSAINIVGLAVGLATCLLILIFVADELSYDKFNKKADRIYRIDGDLQFGGNHFILAVVPDPMGPTLKKDFPQVEQYVRFRDNGGFRVKKGNENVQENKVIYTDSTLFDVFTLPLVAGDPTTALVDPHSIVITAKIAEKYFNSSDVVGKTLTINDTDNYKITAVIKPIPKQSHFNFDFFVSLSSLEESRQNNWLSNNFNTYIVLREGVDPSVIQKRFDVFTDKYVGEQASQYLGMNIEEFKKSGNYDRNRLVPLTRIHLHSDRVGELGVNGNIQYVYIFSAIALIILLIACVNFMNLSTARSANRAKEVGVRKVLGSRKKDLVGQFLSESILISFISLILALGIAELLLPYFNQVSGKQIELGLFSKPWLLPSLLLLVIIVGLLAGSYPSFYLSSFQPVTVLKGRPAGGFKGSSLRSSLVVFQFAVSIILMIGTVVIYEQLNFIRKQKIGYDRDHVLVVKHTYALGDHAKMFKDELLNVKGVEAVTITGYLPTGDYRSDSPLYPDASMDQKNAVSMQNWYVDDSYIPTLHIELAKGRNFSAQMPTDSSAIIINEAAAKLLAFDDPVNKKLYALTSLKNKTSKAYEVIGVVKNFNFNSLRQVVTPMVLFLGTDRGSVAIRFKSADISFLIAAVESKWKKTVPNQPFDYSFMDEDFKNTYQRDQRIGKIAMSFSLLAIFIACLGLFGLSAFAISQRVKEIGIRKVLGADVSGIVTLLSKDFLKLVVVAAIIAFPVAWWVMHIWLQDFAYRINIGWWVFAAAALMAVFIALATVSFQAIKAAVANPVKSLRTE
jgi:putative ABC transport system permease protein